MKKIYFLLVLTFVIVISSCSTKETKPSDQLIIPELLTIDQTKFLVTKGFVSGDEKLLLGYAYYDITKSAILLTEKNIIVFKEGSVEKELLMNLFDLSYIHSAKPETKSKIKMYRRDDSEFSYEFPGGLEIDETFFSKLRTVWRSAIANKQPITEKDSSTSQEGVLLGVKEKKK